MFILLSLELSMEEKDDVFKNSCLIRNLKEGLFFSFLYCLVQQAVLHVFDCIDRPVMCSSLRAVSCALCGL